MRNLILFVFCTFYLLGGSFAQKVDSTQLKLEYGSNILEVQELFRLENIDFYKLVSNDTLLRKYYFQFTLKTYDIMGLVKTDTLIGDENKKDITFEKLDTILTFTLLSRNKTKDTVNFSFNLNGLSTVRPYRKLISDNYSMRDAINSNGKYAKVPLNKSFPLFVYSLPYEDPKSPGYLFYCALTADAVPPDSWGKKYGIKHYIVIALEILPK